MVWSILYFLLQNFFYLKNDHQAKNQSLYDKHFVFIWNSFNIVCSSGEDSFEAGAISTAVERAASGQSSAAEGQTDI